MKDDRDDWAPLLDAWPASAPRAGFADRVLAACDLPPPVQLTIVRDPPPRRTALGGIVVCAAIAAALTLIPIALHRRQPPPSAASMVTLGNSFDLGSEHD